MAGEIARTLRVPRRKIIYYAEQGIVEPTMPAIGRGSARRYNLAAVQRLHLAVRLERFGFAARNLKSLLDELESGSGFVLIGDGMTLTVHRSWLIEMAS